MTIVNGLTGFGQPETGIIQTAFVVTDIRRAIDAWLAEGVGPWFHQERWRPEGATYRGASSTAEISAALCFSGHSQIELLQPLDDAPSVYREILDARGPGFHHIARGTADYDADVACYQAQGHALAFETLVPTGSRVAYLDTCSILPGFVELIETTEANDNFFTAIYDAARGWDGSAPIRSFESLIF
ncbi:VOC family protein [Sphingomonadaceae bacterium G21617-S1]|jgi:hypothetical protein|uniref:VOC family protein n=1 Tax=Rhizorhabdus sp. TaxID=1968843 RepID=UPI00122935E0|nr:VOC family protein [Rhizorhabdus sp.]MBD3760385.1 VOC family protein [Rhizorhabdus sp.]MCZ4340083.1 VOC family protein [Sphingomonadaceae bacterium G21617-S1]TAK08550.1 MAG: VOC family protein [Rhizorhabdus sp.]